MNLVRYLVLMWSVTHGRDKITNLAQHFHVDVKNAVSEWKEVLINVKGKSKITEVLLFIANQRSLYPCLGVIASALLVVPMHSADCERGFSALGRVKTKLHSCLSNKSLNSLLTILLEGPELKEFDFQSCIKEWSNIRKRHVFTGKPQAACSTSTISTQTR